jgi:hypothetical protein
VTAATAHDPTAQHWHVFTEASSLHKRPEAIGSRSSLEPAVLLRRSSIQQPSCWHQVYQHFWSVLLFCCLPAVLLAALAHLRKELRAAGSDLVVRVGPAPTTTAAIAGAAGVKRIVIERQEESR